MTSPISNHDSLITRRSILIGAAASLICAPAIVRATSLMPVRRHHRSGLSTRGSANVYFITRSTVACEQDCEQAKRASISTAQ